MRVPPPVVVLGVVGNDIHVVANRLLENCLREAGFNAINLGVNTMPEEFADAALECGADAILIGSLNGEAAHWSRGLRRLFVERGMPDMLIYLGGNLVMGDLPAKEVERVLEGAGVDHVFQGAIDFDDMINKLKENLARGRS